MGSGKQSARGRPMRYEDVVEMALRLPETVEATSYGTPALKVRGKLFVRLKEDGETIVLRIDPMEREALLTEMGHCFFLTDHYLAYPYVLVKVATADFKLLEELVEDAWRHAAPAKLVRELDNRAETWRSAGSCPCCG
ncbi:MAG TPA: MmcQ/YjbR family DNA-binding protein [Chthonomonadales bacterium]|nr:MmcQ/YjbR family DNA-binding protein [Chthonomonadales bacterium]